MSSRTSSQRGEGKAGCVFWILFFGIAGLIAFRWVPTQVAHAHLVDACDEMAKLYPQKDGDWFARALFKRAQELRIPVKSEDIHVEKTGQRVRIEVEYVVPLDFFVYTYNKKYTIDVERDIFIL